MNKLPKAWKWIIGAGMAILLATLAFYYFTDWQYPVPVDSPTIISLSRGSGWPGISYKVAIYEDGTVVYEGTSYVGAVGIRKHKIEVDQVKDLANMIEQAGFFELEDKYNPPVYDAGHVFVYVRIEQREKEIVRLDPYFDFSDIKVPDSLYRIEDTILETANIDQWVACNFENKRLCGFSPLAIVASIGFFGLALWTAWAFMIKNKGWLGIIFGFVVIICHEAMLIFGNWSFPTAILTQKLISYEFMTFLPASLLLMWWHKRKTKALDSKRA